ncbi:MAG: amidohydrolase family protein, partial [Synergistaceae bacterium]|nr:amidohydrolase family protein [Synergistaceae bacterium]
LGMSLNDIIRCVTETPAKIMGLEGKIGTLKVGAFANITIVKSKQVKIVHKDFKDNELVGGVLLVPQMTLIDGEIQYYQTDFWY